MKHMKLRFGTIRIMIQKDVGNLWLSHNTEIGSSMVYLEGLLQPDCYELSEAWDRGILEIHTTLSGSIVLEHIGAVEEPNICMDEWYVCSAVSTRCRC